MQLPEALTKWLSERSAGFFRFSNFHAILLILTSLVSLFFLIEAARLLPVTGENVYPESSGVLAAQRWVQGQPLYSDYRQPPYLITAFPPLWYAFLAGAAKLGFSSLDSLTLFGRILTLVSLLGTSALIFFWNRRVGISPALAFLAPGLYLSFPILVPWAVTARPDFPALFFSFLAVFLLARPNSASIGMAAVAAALGFLFRHNAVAAPVAIVLWLLWSRKWKQAGLFCAIWGLVVGAVMLPFEMSSRGLVQLNLSGAKFGPVALTYVRDVLSRLLDSPGSGFAILLFAFGVFGFVQSWKEKNESFRLIRTYLLVSLSLAVVGSSVAGAGVNHYLEPALAMAALVPMGLAQLKQTWTDESHAGAFAMVLVVLLLLPSVDSQRWNAMHGKPEDLRRVASLMEKRQVFSDIPYLAARASMPQTVDLASLINTERSGSAASWSSAQLVEGLKEKKYELVILSTPVYELPYDPAAHYPRTPRLDAEMQKAIGMHYRLCFELDTSYVYSPLAADPKAAESPCPALAGSSTLQSNVQSYH